MTFKIKRSENKVTLTSTKTKSVCVYIWRGTSDVNTSTALDSFIVAWSACLNLLNQSLDLNEHHKTSTMHSWLLTCDKRTSENKCEVWYTKRQTDRQMRLRGWD